MSLFDRLGGNSGWYVCYCRAVKHSSTAAEYAFKA